MLAEGYVAVIFHIIIYASLPSILLENAKITIPAGL